MKKVEYFNERFKKRKLGEAIFLQFGIDYIESKNGIGNFSIAILKKDNGEVFFVDADCIKFI